MPVESIHESDESGRPIMKAAYEEDSGEDEIKAPPNKFKKWGLNEVFGGGGLALVSEPLANNGVDTTITNTCLAAGTIIMIAGCVALILSERKPKTT